MDDFEGIARRMRELNLQRDRPFGEPLEPTWEQELNAKLLPKPVEDDQPMVDDFYG